MIKHKNRRALLAKRCVFGFARKTETYSSSKEKSFTYKEIMTIAVLRRSVKMREIDQDPEAYRQVIGHVWPSTGESMRAAAYAEEGTSDSTKHLPLGCRDPNRARSTLPLLDWLRGLQTAR